MSTEENKVLVRRILSEFTTGNLEVVDELFAEDFINHSPGRGMTPDRKGLKQYQITMHTAAPDMQTTIEDMIAEGDKVVVRMTVSGTHKGDYGAIPATGKRVEVPAIGILRIARGKVIERWAIADELTLLQQIGVIPATG